jgi:integrase
MRRMPKARSRDGRTRGSITELPSRRFRVRVYSGLDPVTKRRMYLTETVDTMAQAQRARTRLLNQVDERRNPWTTATISQLIDRWLEVVDVEPSTRQGYERKIG